MSHILPCNAETLALAVPEIFHLVQNSIESRDHDHDHAPFRDDFSSTGLGCLRSTYTPNLKSLGAPVKMLRTVVQNVENGVVWGG